MNFLQPWVLWALPLIALPILIHLIHRLRHRVVEWGAMMFLLEGAKMSRGRQRLREFLLLAMRTLAVIGLLFAIGRPIAGGWVGRMGGKRVDTVVLIIDRSASMSERMPGQPDSKLKSGLRNIASALAIAKPEDLVVIDGVRPGTAVRIDGMGGITDLGLDLHSDASSDLPAAFETAVKYLEAAEAGRSEVWTLSDAQTSDWSPEDGRWRALSDALAGLPAGVRVRLSTFPSVAEDNLGIRVERVRRLDKPGNEAELVLDIVVTRASASDSFGDNAMMIPVAVEVGGARSTVEIELVGGEARLQGYRIPIDATVERGFGAVSITPDARPADDTYWFVFGMSEELETLAIAERKDAGRVLSIAARVPMDPTTELISRVRTPEEAMGTGSLELAGVTLLLWQAPLPVGDVAGVVDRFIEEGGVVAFFPPEVPSGNSYRDVSWGPWMRGANLPSPDVWRSDDDLFRRGTDGVPLPVGELEMRSYCKIETAEATGDALSSDASAHLTLASLPGGDRLLVRATSPRGGVYFFAALPTADSTNLASEGLVLVAMVQRALESAVVGRGSDIQQTAGRDVEWVTDQWIAANDDEGMSVLERAYSAGVLTDGTALVALNRPITEDASTPQPLAALRELFGSVEVVGAEASTAEEGSSLLEEIWRIFMWAALIGLIVEALLCASEGMSKKERTASAEGGF